MGREPKPDWLRFRTGGSDFSSSDRIETGAPPESAAKTELGNTAAGRFSGISSIDPHVLKQFDVSVG
jgi:hypothetical protein